MSKTLIFIIVFAGLLVFYVLLSLRRMKNMPLVPSNEKIKILDDRNFKQQIRNGKVLVDFWAAWCAPCRVMAPILNELADVLDGEAVIAKLDVDQNRQTASAFKIRGIPTMILFKNGREVERFVGVKSRDLLLKKIRET